MVWPWRCAAASAGPSTCTPAVGAAPAMAAASASKPAARKPRPALGVGWRCRPMAHCGWQVSMGAACLCKTPRHRRARRLRWSAPRVLDTAGDAISADGENHPKLVFGPRAVLIDTQPLASPIRVMCACCARWTGAAFCGARHGACRPPDHHPPLESMGFDAEGVLHGMDRQTGPGSRPKVGGKSSYQGLPFTATSRAMAGPPWSGPPRLPTTLASAVALRSVWAAMGPCGPCGGMCSSPMCATTPLPCCAGRPRPMWCVPPTTSGGWMAARTRPGAGAGGRWFPYGLVRYPPGRRDKVSGVRYARLAPDGTPRLQTVHAAGCARRTC